MAAKSGSSPKDTEGTDASAELPEATVADDAMPTAPAITGPRGEASSEPITVLRSVLSDQGRHLLELGQDPDGTLIYVDVEYFGDPVLFEDYETRPVDGMPGELDVNVNGRWAR